jgi:hypothetical protein
MGLGRSPALWAAALGGIAFAALFDLLSVKQEQEQNQEEMSHEAEDKQQPAVPAYRLSTPGVSAAPSPRVTTHRATRHITFDQHEAARTHTLPLVVGRRSVRSSAEATGPPSAEHAAGKGRSGAIGHDSQQRRTAQ